MKLVKSNQMMEIPIKIDVYNTFVKRLKGLMFRVKPLENNGIQLIPCNSIHMFFMFIHIDVVFLNKQNTVIFLKQNVKPWTIIPPIKHAHSAIELPNHAINDYKISIGDQLFP